MDDYRVKGVAPDMDEAAFLAVLRAGGSPVSGAEARVVYAYCAERRVSPAWLLAVFRHESSFGTAGTATQTRSWGNTRRPSFGVPDIGEVPGRSGRFSQYADWADGGKATVARICEHAPYATAATVRQLTPIWAPSSDGNNVERYVAAVLADIARWARPQGPPPDPAVAERGALLDYANAIPREYRGDLMREGVVDLAELAGGGKEERLAVYQRLVANRYAGQSCVMFWETWDDLRARGKVALFG